MIRMKPLDAAALDGLFPPMSNYGRWGVVGIKADMRNVEDARYFAKVLFDDYPELGSATITLWGKPYETVARPAA